MNQVVSQLIGPLRQDEHILDCWQSEPVPIAFFDGDPLPISYLDYDPKEDPDFVEKADEALKHFFRLGKKEREDVSVLVYKNCFETLEAGGSTTAEQQMGHLTNEDEIWRYVRPIEIHITRRAGKDRDLYVQVVCDCGWNEEHGLQLVFRQGRQLTRVSDLDGHLTEADARDTPDRDDELLSRF